MGSSTDVCGCHHCLLSATSSASADGKPMCGRACAVMCILLLFACVSIVPCMPCLLQVRRIQLTTQMLSGAPPIPTAGPGMIGGVAGPLGQDTLGPVPERLWAVRNVANNMLRFGNPGQVCCGCGPSKLLPSAMMPSTTAVNRPL